MSVLQCNYMYLYHISFMHITVNKLSIKHIQSRHRLPRHSSDRLTHPLPGSVHFSFFGLKHLSPPWHVHSRRCVLASPSPRIVWSSTITRALDHFQYVIWSKRHIVRNGCGSQRCGTVVSGPSVGQMIHVLVD